MTATTRFASVPSARAALSPRETCYMQPLGATSPSPLPLWHPNLRILARAPSLKTSPSPYTVALTKSSLHPQSRSPPPTGWAEGIYSTPHLPAEPRIQSRALRGARRRSGETSTPSPNAVWTLGRGAPGPLGRPAEQAVPAGQPVHLGTHGLSPPPRLRRLLPGRIPVSPAPPAPLLPPLRPPGGGARAGSSGNL